MVQKFFCCVPQLVQAHVGNRVVDVVFVPHHGQYGCQQPVLPHAAGIAGVVFQLALTGQPAHAAELMQQTLAQFLPVAGFGQLAQEGFQYIECASH